MEKITVRGIEIVASPNQAAFVDFLMNETGVRQGVMVAINAEKIILADEDLAIAELIAQADYKYADGISVVHAVRQKDPSRKLARIAGVDLWEALMERAMALQLPVFVLGAEAAVLNATVEKLKARGVVVAGSRCGYFENEEAIFSLIRESGAKFVSVAMGSPKQEQFMLRARQYYPDCLYMGVGGTYDVFVGKVKRAPKSWQNLGLEWLYRLLSQPTRWRRQLRLLKFAYYYVTKQL